MQNNWSENIPITKKIRNLFIRKIRKFSFEINISIDKWIPKLEIHEKYENIVKYTLRSILAVGIITSIINFQIWYWNLALALALLAFDQFLEKAVLIFSTLFITPIPENFDTKNWLGIVWGYSRKGKFIVGPFFDSNENADKMFNCLRSWNYNKTNDFQDNICISAIIERDGKYSLYIYPGLNRRSQKEWEDIQKQKESATKKHQGIVLQIMFCKQFDFEGSTFADFIKYYRDGYDYEFAPFVLRGGNLSKLDSKWTIQKNNLKIKKREELNKKDLEYDHGRMVMGY